MTRVAVVDLGSNSTRLLVADIRDGVAHELERRITITRLAETVDSGGRLVPRAIERVHACLADYLPAIERHAPAQRLAYATSAVRDAANGSQFLADLGERFGLATRLLSGDEEALLTLRGVASGRSLTGPTVLVDLGGGSTEIVVTGDDGRLGFHTSVDIGCVRLAERFPPENGIGSCDREALVLHVRRLLIDTVPFDVPPTRGIGTAGTVTTLGALHLGLDREDPARLHGHRLPATWIAQEAQLLARTSVAELERRAGIDPRRAAVIGAGALAIAEIVGYFELPALEISETDILHGVALEAAAAAA